MLWCAFLHELCWSSGSRKCSIGKRETLLESGSHLYCDDRKADNPTNFLHTTFLRVEEPLINLPGFQSVLPGAVYRLEYTTFVGVVCKLAMFLGAEKKYLVQPHSVSQVAESPCEDRQPLPGTSVDSAESSSV